MDEAAVLLWSYTLAGASMDQNTQKIKIEQHIFVGGIWFAAWLFTVGFLHLSFWKGLLATILWPYYLSVTFSHLAH